MSAVDELVTYVTAGARLRSELAPFEADFALHQEGGKVFYAVDTNIIWFYLNPGYYGPKRDGIGGYAHVFPGDDDERVRVAEALAAALSRYIIHHLNRFPSNGSYVEAPLLLLDGHDAEVRATYDRLVTGVNRQSKTKLVHVARLKEALLALERVDEKEEQADQIRSSAQYIIEWLYLDTSELAQAKRISGLLTRGRLARLPAAAERVIGIVGERNRREISKAFNPPADLIDRLWEGKLRQDWDQRLRKRKRADRELNLRADSHALARLEALNTALAPLKIRVCLITGDRSMIDAASAHRAENQEQTFLEMYIRHPRAFLAARQVLMPAVQDKDYAEDLGLVSSWLDTLLARFSSDDRPSLKQLSQITSGKLELRPKAERVLELDPQAIGTLKADWARHTLAVRDEHAASSALAQEEIRRVVGKQAYSELHGILDSVEEALSSASDDTWDSYYLALVRTGFDLVQAGGGEPRKRRRRNAPPINFETFTEAKEFVRAIVAARGENPFAADEIERRLRLIECQGGGYAVLLAYAVLFADSGRWHVALLTAQRAIAVAELYDQGRISLSGDENLDKAIRDKISGREAFFFAAVAQRMTARDADDLDKAECFLAEARKALERDNRRRDAPADSMLRFDSEGLALALTRYLFRRFSKGNQDSSYLSGEPRRLREEALRKANEAALITDDWARRLVERNSLTNVFTCLAFEDPDAAPRDDDPAISNAASRLVQMLKDDKSAPKPDVPVTELVAIVGMYAEAAYLPLDRQRRRQLRNGLLAFEESCKSEQADLIMPYDFDRYMHMVMVSRRALADR